MRLKYSTDRHAHSGLVRAEEAGPHARQPGTSY